MDKITVLGAGAWGTAFATLLANNGYRVTLWSYEQSVAGDIMRCAVNIHYLPDVKLSHLITVTCDLSEAVRDADWIFEAIPVKFIRSIAHQAKENMSESAIWVVLSKGIEQETLKLPSQILDDVFDYPVKKAVVGGPNYAKELARSACTATVIASDNTKVLCQLIDMLENDYFIPYPSRDVIGVQVGGAVKNVMALVAGIARGSGQAENTIAYLVTEGLDEIARMIVHFGGERETAYRHAGLGDLILTCLGTLSKNVQVGQLLGKGKTLNQIVQERKTVLPEGINTVTSVSKMALREKLDLPICQAAYEVIFDNKPFDTILNRLRSYHCMDKNDQGCND